MAKPPRRETGIDDKKAQSNITGEVHPDADEQDAIIDEMFPDQPSAKAGGGRRGRIKAPQASVAQWNAQIAACKRFYEKRQNSVRSTLKRFKNQHQGRIGVPLLTPMIEIKAAMSTFRSPYISVRPRKRVTPTMPQEILAAGVKEVYINWLWGELDLKAEIRRVVKDALIHGRGITIPGYNAIVDAEGTVEYDSVIADRVSPFDYYLDIEADSSRNAWYGIRVIYMPVPVAERQFGKKGIFQPQVISRHQKTVSDENTAKNAIRAYGRTIIYEIQDLLADRFLYITPGYNKFLLQFDNPFGTDGLLPEFLEPMPVPDEIECVSEANLVAGQLDELSRLRSYWMEHWKKLVPKYLMPNNLMSHDDREKFVSADSTTIIEVSGNPNDMTMAPIPSLPADMSIHEANIKQDIRDITGFNEYLQGSKVPGTKTAYETSEIIAGSNIRVSDLNDFVEQHCSKLARKMLQIASRFVGASDMQLIAGLPVNLSELIQLPPGTDLSITDEIMKMETDVTVHTGSMQLKSKESDMQRASLLQAFLAFPEANRYAILQKMAELLDENANEILLPPEVIDEQKQEEARMAAQEGGGGGGRESAGRKTGSAYGSRPRTDLMVPGGR